jgi:hypothetical protein
MRNTFTLYACVLLVVLAGLIAPSAHAAVYSIGRISEPSEAFTADNAGSGDSATEAARRLPTDYKIPFTEMPALPEVSTWGMLLLWFIGAGLAVVRVSRKRRAPDFE